MKRPLITLLIPVLVMPLLGTTCLAFRSFQVRPYVASGGYGIVTLSMLVDDYYKVTETTRRWADEEKLTEQPCRSASEVSHATPACRIFHGNLYTVSVTFNPRENSTAITVISNTHKVAEDSAARLKRYLLSQLGEGVIADNSGGEVPNSALKRNLGDAARPSAP